MRALIYFIYRLFSGQLQSLLLSWNGICRTPKNDTYSSLFGVCMCVSLSSGINQVPDAISITPCTLMLHKFLKLKIALNSHVVNKD